MEDRSVRLRLRLASSLVAALALAASAGCGSSGGSYRGPVSDNPSPGGGGGGMPDGGTGGGPDGASPLPYPEGHFGSQQGDVFPNFTLSGYRMAPDKTDVASLTWASDIKMGEYFANKSCKCLVVNLGALWCPACQQEQPKLVSEVSGDPSFCVMDIVQEGIQHNSAATMSDVDAWAKSYKQNFYVVQGTAQTRQLFQGHGMTVGLPFNFIVRPSTMVIAGIVQGYRTDIHGYAMGVCAQGE